MQVILWYFYTLDYACTEYLALCTIRKASWNQSVTLNWFKAVFFFLAMQYNFWRYFSEHSVREFDDLTEQCRLEWSARSRNWWQRWWEIFKPVSRNYGQGFIIIVTGNLIHCRTSLHHLSMQALNSQPSLNPERTLKNVAIVSGEIYSEAKSLVRGSHQNRTWAKRNLPNFTLSVNYVSR